MSRYDFDSADRAADYRDERALASTIAEEVHVFGMFHVDVLRGEADPETVVVTDLDELLHDMTAGEGTPWETSRALYAWLGTLEQEPQGDVTPPKHIGELIVEEYANRIAEQAREVA